jgi:hypothetical protein
VVQTIAQRIRTSPTTSETMIWISFTHTLLRRT